MIWGSKLMVPKLSARQLEIAKWLAEGKTVASIATILGISENTVNFHKKQAFKKMERNFCYSALRQTSL